MHWVGPETLIGLEVEGREVDTLADSGSQVNTVMPGYVHQHESPVLLLHDLVNHTLNLVGLGSTRYEITGNDEDVVFLVVPDELEFSQHVNMIKESEMDRLLTPWAMVRTSHLLSWQGTVVEDLGTAGDGPMEEGAAAAEPTLG